MLRGATQPLRMPCVCVWKFFFLTRKHNRHTQNLISINKTYCSHRHKKHTYTHAIQKLKKNYSDAWLQYFLTRNNDSQINRVWPIRVKYPMFRYLGKKIPIPMPMFSWNCDECRRRQIASAGLCLYARIMYCKLYLLYYC